MQRLIDINELSRLLSIPKGTLYNWAICAVFRSSRPGAHCVSTRMR